MNNLTVTLDTAKRLKEAGWDKETYFWYAYDREHSESQSPYQLIHLKDFGYCYFEKSNSYPAPTLRELLDEMPEILENHRGKNYFVMQRVGNIYTCGYSLNSVHSFFHGIARTHTNPCEAVAELFLKLKSEQLI
jgi:hypothetical protein